MKYDYKWDQIDKADSSIFDFSDVISPALDLADYEGHILKWNKAEEAFELAEDSEGVSGEISSAQILDETISDVDISSGAEIQLSKIENYNAGFAKLPYSGGIVMDFQLDDKELQVGGSGKVIIRDSQGGDEVIRFSDLKEDFDDLVLLYKSKENEATLFGSMGGSTTYMSGERDSTTGQYVWRNFYSRYR